MLTEKNEAIAKAYERLQVLSQDEKKRMEYEAREKALRDHNEVMLEATERGFAKGMAAGEEIGRLKTLFDLVKDGILTISAAAEKAKMEPSEFERKYNESLRE